MTTNTFVSRTCWLTMPLFIFLTAPQSRGQFSPCPNDFAEATLPPGTGGERLSRFGCVAAPEPVPSGATAIRVVFRTLYNTTFGDPDGADVCVPRSLLASPPPSLSQFEGQTRWLGGPNEIADEPEPLNYIAAPLVCTAEEAEVRDWSPAGLQATFGDDALITRVFFYGAAIVPCSVYEVSQCADPLDELTCSEPVLILTARTGDCFPEFATAGQPNFLDINALVVKFHSIPFWPGPPPSGVPEWQGLLYGNVVGNYDEQVYTAKVGFRDINIAVESFKGLPYKHNGPCDPDTGIDNCAYPCSTTP